MTIDDIFSAATEGITGIKVDVYTCILAVVAILLIIFAIQIIGGFLLDFHYSEKQEDEKGLNNGENKKNV